jgi:2-succinyl-6-hydroxy-2,4-cyclohexadiene-1-carboxylate synthase
MTACLEWNRSFARPNMRTMVFLHGFMGSSSSFRTLLNFFPKEYSLIAADLPGHGRSLFGKRECLASLRSFEDVAALVLADLFTAGIERFSLYGYSMGGRIAQQIALSAPQRVDCLVLESAGFGISEKAMRRARYENDCRMLENLRDGEDFERFLSKWHDMDLFSTLSADIKKRLKMEKGRNDTAELNKAMRVLSAGNQAHLLPDLGSAPFPMALFYGAEDARYMALAAEAAKVLPQARFRFFPGASHDIHAQFPEIVANETIDFLKSVYSDKL